MHTATAYTFSHMHLIKNSPAHPTLEMAYLKSVSIQLRLWPVAAECLLGLVVVHLKM